MSVATVHRPRRSFLIAAIGWALLSWIPASSSFAQDASVPDACRELVTVVEEGGGALVRARALRGALEAGADAECLRLAWRVFEARIERASTDPVAYSEARTTVNAMTLATDADRETLGLTRAEFSAGSRADLWIAFWTMVRVTSAPVGTALGESNAAAIVASILARLREGVARAAPLVVYDFRRALLDTSSIGTSRTCAVGFIGSPVRALPSDEPPRGRAVRLPISCLAPDGSVSVHLWLWVTNDEGLGLLDATDIWWLGVRILRVGRFDTPEATIDTDMTATLDRLRVAVSAMH